MPGLGSETLRRAKWSPDRLDKAKNHRATDHEGSINHRTARSGILVKDHG